MSFTTVPAAGAKLRAGTLQALFAEVRPVSGFKTLDESVSSATTGSTFQADDEMFATVEASVVYRAQLHVVFVSGVTPDFKIRMTVPTGATTPNWSYVIKGSADVWVPTTGLTGIAGDATAESMDAFGLVVVSTTPGTVAVEWAQNTSDPGSTNTQDGSFLVLTRIT